VTAKSDYQVEQFMHFAFDIKGKDFDIRSKDLVHDRDEFLGWGERDRVGIVVDRPCGALEASLFLAVAATAFYDAKVHRRKRPLYPEMYLFHVGGPWGAHLALDFTPEHKEVFIEENGDGLLPAINHCGITHLLVPDRVPRDIKYPFKEPEAARDRIKMAFAYGELTSTADVAISTHRFKAFEESYEHVLFPALMVERSRKRLETDDGSPGPAGFRVASPTELAQVVDRLALRVTEVSADDPDRLRQIARFEIARGEGSLTERYRSISVDEALQMLP
jgi:hypothetical protein